MNPSISILLSTYNGSAYVKQQIDSILAQTYTDWKLLIRDDGSTDDTPLILQHFAKLLPDKITFIHDDVKKRGAKLSYAALLQQSATPYVAFADQDDFWEPNKLELLMQAMQSAETRYGTQMPILVHSDLAVVDENLVQLNRSFYSHTGLDVGYARNHTILCRNVIPGCAMLINDSLKNRAGVIPEAAIMHDYWLVLFARYTGKIIFVNQPLVWYRQHSNNALGASTHVRLTMRKVLRNLWWYIKGADFYNERFAPYVDQAAAFCERFPVGESRIAAPRAFVQLQPGTSRRARKYAIIRYRLKAGTFMENLELLLCG